MRTVYKVAFVLAMMVGACGSAQAISAQLGDYGLFFWSGPNSSAEFYNGVTQQTGGSLAIDFSPQVALFVVDRLAPGDIFAPIVAGSFPAWSLAFFDNFGNFHGVLSGLNGLLPVDLGVPVTTCGPPGFSNCVGTWVVGSVGAVPLPAGVYLLASGLLALIGVRRRRT